MTDKAFTILIVDDESLLRETLASNYEIEGHRVLQASGGEEAIKICQGQKIDFVISDVRMPEGTGVYLLEELRRTNPELPIIVLISGFAEITKEEAIEKGALDLMAKPIDFEKLDAYINEYYEKKK